MFSIYQFIEIIKLSNLVKKNLIVGLKIKKEDSIAMK